MRLARGSGREASTHWLPDAPFALSYSARRMAVFRFSPIDIHHVYANFISALGGQAQMALRQTSSERMLTSARQRAEGATKLIRQEALAGSRPALVEDGCGRRGRDQSGPALSRLS
jgi:hypothetical protein